MGQLTESGQRDHSTPLSSAIKIVEKGGVVLSSRIAVAWSLLVGGRE